MKRTSKLLAVLLSVMLIASAAGCSTGDTSWVYEVDGERMPAGVYILNTLTAYGFARHEVRSEDNLQPSKKQVMNGQIDGKNGETWVKDKAESYVLQYIGIQQKAKEMSFLLDGEDLSSAVSYAQTIWSGTGQQTAEQYDMYEEFLGPLPAAQYLLRFDQSTLEKNGVSYESLEQFYKVQNTKAALFDLMYGPGGDSEVPEDELLQKMDEMLAKASYLTIPKATHYHYEDEDEEEHQEEEELEAANAELRKQAEEYLARLKDGEKIEDLELDYRQSTAAEGAEVQAPEEGDLDLVVAITEEPTDYVLGDAIQSATVGQPILVEDDSAFYVLQRKSLRQDTQELETYRTNVLYELKWDEFEQMLEAVGAEADKTTNEAAVSRYTIGKVTVK